MWPTIASSGWDTLENAQKFEKLSQRADPIIFAFGEAVDFQNRIGRERYNIVIRIIGSEEAGTRGVRISTHIFVSLKQIDKVLEGVKYLVDHR